MLTTTKTTATKTTGIAQKTIHNTISTAAGHEQYQTDQICTETLKRVENILSGPHSGAFCKVMDICVSGYGKLHIDSELLLFLLYLKKKINFEKKIFYSTDNKTSYEVQSEAIEHH